MSVTSAWHPSMGSPSERGHVETGLHLTGRGGMGRWIVLAVGTAVLLASAVGVTRSRIFAMRTLEVRGIHHLTRANVAALGHLTGSVNTVWLQAGSIEQRLERSPWILRATVTRSLPSAVSVTIEERSAIAVVGTHRFLLAADGTVLGEAPRSLHLPEIAGAFGAEVKVGTRLTTALPELKVAQGLPPGTLSMVSLIAIGSRGEVTVTLRSGLPVIYGDESRPWAKGQALQAVLEWAAGAGVTPAYVDVSAPSAPALLPPPPPVAATEGSDAQAATGSTGGPSPATPSPSASPSAGH
jgi:cell division septal protein FtsQ